MCPVVVSRPSPGGIAGHLSRKRLGLIATAGRRPSGPGGNFVALRARLSEEGTFRVRIGARKDDASIQKGDAGLPLKEFLTGAAASGPTGDISLSATRGPFEGRVTQPTGTIPEEGPCVRKESCRRLPGGRARWYFLTCACPGLPRSTCQPRISYAFGSRRVICQ